MNYTELTPRHIVSGIQSGNPIHLARLGDGEWGCMLGYGHLTSTAVGDNDREAIGAALVEIMLRRPNYWIGSFTKEACTFHANRVTNRTPLFRRIPNWIKENGLCDLKWTGNCTLLDSAAYEWPDPLYASLVDSSIQKIVVGPEHTGVFAARIYATHIPVVNRCIMRNYQQRVIDVGARVMEVAKPGSVVLIAAAAFANVLVDYLHDKLPECSLLDVGSYADFHSGVVTRNWIRMAHERKANAQERHST